MNEHGQVISPRTLRCVIRFAGRWCQSCRTLPKGFERGGDQEFLQFLAIAKGSCGEVRAQLYVAFDQGYLSPGEFDVLAAVATDVSKLIAGLMRYIRQSAFKGSKYA